VLDTAVTKRVPKAAKEAARLPGAPSLRRDLGEDFAPRRRSVASTAGMVREDEDYSPRRRAGGLRLRVSGLAIPRSWIGRVAAGTVVVAALGATLAGMWEARRLLLTNPRLVLESSSAIQITGNSHLTRAQLLTVFGEDVERNILTVPLDARRAELERLPWVQHATVMRLLPDRFRVAITERTPVAFVRQGTQIGLVDANGVLLDMASDGDASEETHYSFPVVTGIVADDPLSVRAARMKLYAKFMKDLGEQTQHVSEVDMSNPEDIKALIPDGSTDILVHFGDKDFLHRYELYEKNLPGWKSLYPKLGSADMRYEREVVLEMQPGSAVPTNNAAALSKSVESAAKAIVKHRATPPPTKKLPEMGHPGNSGHLTTAFDVKAKTKSKQAGPR
jgi:cell division protein FtsQ